MNHSATALTYAADLRLLIERGPMTLADFAKLRERVLSNVKRDVPKLAAQGYLNADADGVAPTDLARQFIAGIDVAEGRAAPIAAGTGGPLTRTYAQLRNSPLNPRKDFTSDEAVAARDSIRESILTRGQLQDLLIRPAGPDGVHEIIVGETRWRAIGEAIEDDDLPEDFAIKVEIRDVTDAEHIEIAMAENELRRDLNVIERANGYAALIAAGRSTADVAGAYGKTPEHVQQHLRILKLSPADQARMLLPKDDANRLTFRQARDLVAELSPKVAVALIEFGAAASGLPAAFGLGAGYVSLFCRPYGAWATLVERKLIDYAAVWFNRRDHHARITAAGWAWLDANGCAADCVPVLRDLRAQALGADKSEALFAAGRWASEWLNGPPARADTSANPQPKSRDLDQTGFPTAPAPAPATHSSPAPDPTGKLTREPTASEAMVLRDIAARIERNPVTAVGAQRLIYGKTGFNPLGTEASLVTIKALIRYEDKEHGVFIQISEAGRKWQAANPGVVAPASGHYPDAGAGDDGCAVESQPLAERFAGLDVKDQHKLAGALIARRVYDEQGFDGGVAIGLDLMARGDLFQIAYAIGRRVAGRSAMSMNPCRACGCTAHDACDGGCAWANRSKTLCTQCSAFLDDSDFAEAADEPGSPTEDPRLLGEGDREAVEWADTDTPDDGLVEDLADATLAATLAEMDAEIAATLTEAQQGQLQVLLELGAVDEASSIHTASPRAGSRLNGVMLGGVLISKGLTQNKTKQAPMGSRCAHYWLTDVGLGVARHLAAQRTAAATEAA